MAHLCLGSAAPLLIDWQPLPEPWGGRMTTRQGKDAHHPGVQLKAEPTIPCPRSAVWTLLPRMPNFLSISPMVINMLRIVLPPSTVHSCPPASRDRGRSTQRKISVDSRRAGQARKESERTTAARACTRRVGMPSQCKQDDSLPAPALSNYPTGIPLSHVIPPVQPPSSLNSWRSHSGTLPPSIALA
jgi:hypothetical protein